MRTFFCFLLCMSFSAGSLFSLETKDDRPDIFDILTEKTEGQGLVVIRQDSRMNILLDKKEEANEGKKYIYITGYRVQAYLGNNHKKSKEETFEREKIIKDKFPNVSTYVTFNSPFWRLRIGDFRTYADALVLSKQLKTEFPDFSDEISVIKDDEVRDLELEKE